jgi:hypothetical protein
MPDLQSRAVNSAISALKQSLAAGLPNLDRIRMDPTFSKIRESSEFKLLLRAANHGDKPEK